MKTSGTFTFLFVALMLFSLISCSQLRQDKPACTTPYVDRRNCDESRNTFNGRKRPNKCLEDKHCAAGRRCSESQKCRD